MDVKKLNIPTLDGPNWGQYINHLQAALRILDCYDVVKGELLTPPPNPTYDLLVKPTHLGQQTTAAQITAYRAEKAIWKKKNGQALGIMQATILPIIWQDYVQHGKACTLYNAFKTAFRQARGASTYLQLVNMVKVTFTDAMDLLPQIQQFQDNYNHIMSYGHSCLSEDLTTFMFCSSLPESYEATARQYLNNIMVIANYKLMDIITQVLQEESRRKAQALGHSSSLNKSLMMKNIDQKCAKCGKMNHTTQNHWPGGKNPNKGKGQKPQKALGSRGGKRRKMWTKRKGTTKCQHIRHCRLKQIVDN